MKGFTNGTIEGGDTFNADYAQLGESLVTDTNSSA
jgi:hypothetical protein